MREREFFAHLRYEKYISLMSFSYLYLPVQTKERVGATKGEVEKKKKNWILSLQASRF